MYAEPTPQAKKTKLMYILKLVTHGIVHGAKVSYHTYLVHQTEFLLLTRKVAKLQSVFC